MEALLRRVFPILICSCLFVNLGIKAQPNFQNEVSVGTSLVILPSNEVRLRSLFNQFQVSYQYCFKHLSVEASYSFWNSQILVDEPVGGGLTYIFEIDTSQWVGTIDGRFKYQFIDLAVSYDLRPIKNVSVSFGIGPSYTWGTNSYITGYFYSSGIPDWVLWYDEKNEARLGGIAEIKCKYFFFDQRLCAGIHGKKRIYPNYYRQFEGGIGIGMKF